MVEFLEFSNNILNIAIVIISISMLLYNITRNSRDRVNRASSILLGCVSWSYIADIFIALEPAPPALESWLRWQWIGVALVPATMFHLSDALLATTGLISRGRRRRVVRLLYIVGLLLSLAALSGDWLIRDLTPNPIWHMQAGWLFFVYLAYFLTACSIAIVNVLRAWQRCLTTYTRRRMTYLLAAFSTPAWGIFPYSLPFSLLSSGLHSIPESALWLIFNIANLAVLAMLAFMAYPLSFFGAYKPDRVVKAELLEFMLRGPLMGVVIVAVIESFPHVTSILGIQGEQFISLAAVGAVLCLQWGITLIMPKLESFLVYTHDQQQARMYHEISRRLLTRADIAQLQEAILAAVCDQLRVPTAFIASIGPNGARLEQHVGYLSEEEELQLKADFANGPSPEKVRQIGRFFVWRSFWLVPLRHPESSFNTTLLLGLMGIWARAPEPNLSFEERHILQALAGRSAEILANTRLQTQIIATIEELIPEQRAIEAQRATISPFGQLSIIETGQPSGITKPPLSVASHPDFIDMVRDALRDYWGGPKLVESELLKLGVVNHMALKDGNRVNALRNLLVNAIERLRPEGQQNFTRTDWILYNILEMRFLQGRKVRDTARRLAMSDADFYRKQRTAIEEIARIIAELEQQHVADTEPGGGTAAETFHDQPTIELVRVEG
jgi:signal transduction histidine kinase